MLEVLLSMKKGLHLCKDPLHDLVPFVQFKKREKHPWGSVNFSKVAGLLKLTLLHGCLSPFLNCSNGTKSHKAPHLGILTKFFFPLKSSENL